MSNVLFLVIKIAYNHVLILHRCLKVYLHYDQGLRHALDERNICRKKGLPFLNRFDTGKIIASLWSLNLFTLIRLYSQQGKKCCTSKFTELAVFT